MSHFTYIKTKFRDKKHLVGALRDLDYSTNVPSEAGMSVVDLVVTNPDHAEDHPIVEAQISIASDIGFKWNQYTETFELIADEQTWDLDIPVNRFIEKLTQQYALRCLTDSVKEEGYEIAEQKKIVEDGSVELVVTRWD